MRWLLTYADMITLLLALFIILFSISTINKVKLQRLVHEISGGFNSVDAINNPPEGGGLEKAQQTQELKTEQQIIQTYIQQKHLENRVSVRMTNEGLTVTLLTDKAFYDSGSAVLRPETEKLLDQIAAVLRRTNPEIRVEGYTDNQPIHTAEYPTNWELSGARAAGVTRYLVEKQRYDPAKVSLAGYGEWRPKHTNATDTGRQLNRRVDIVILSANSSLGRKIINPAVEAAPKPPSKPAPKTVGQGSTITKGQ